MKKFILFISCFVCALFFTTKIQGALNLESTIGTKTINCTNCVRQADYLVVYTKEYNRNAMGHEVLVDSTTNFVIEKGVNVTFRNGTYIVSGHGVNSDFIADKVEVGDIVTITGETVTFKRHLRDSNVKKIELEKAKRDFIDKRIKRKSLEVLKENQFLEMKKAKDENTELNYTSTSVCLSLFSTYKAEKR